MKKFNIIFILLLFISCNNKKDYYEFFKSNDLKIPIIERTIKEDTVKFIVDTGSNISLIDSTWYSKNKELFEEKEHNELVINGIYKIVEVNTVIVSTKINNNLVHFAVVDLSPITNTLILKDIHIVGILGSDYMQYNKLIIDYNKQMIYSTK